MELPTTDDAGYGPGEHAALTRYQLLIIVLTIFMAALDGFDAFSSAFVAPAVAREWNLGSAGLGMVLSSGFIGMALGSILIAPLADLRGRRPVILGCLALMTAGSLLSALATSALQLAACRAFTGLGVGAVISLSTSLAAEFANARYRPFIVAVTAQGFPAGNIVGGIAAAFLMPVSGWRSVFLAGGVAGFVLLILLGLMLVESPSYLLARATPEALVRLNHTLTRLGHETVAVLPAQPQFERKSLGALFEHDAAALTVRLTLINMLSVMASFFLLSWLPQFIVTSGFTPASGSIVASTTALSGIIGGVMIGAVGMAVRPALVAGVCSIIAGFGIVLVGSMPPDLILLATASALFGFFLSPSTGLFYATMADAFQPLSRTSGTGLVLGAGRLAGAAGPALAGLMFAHGWQRWETCALFAIAPVIAGALLLGCRSRVEKESCDRIDLRAVDVPG